MLKKTETNSFSKFYNKKNKWNKLQNMFSQKKYTTVMMGKNVIFTMHPLYLSINCKLKHNIHIFLTKNNH